MLDKIAIDLDGTISNSLPNYIRILNKKFGYNLKYNDIKDWYFENLGVKTEHIKELFSMPETFFNTIPYTFSPPVVNYLNNMLRVEVHIVTDRPLDFYDLTKSWLSKYNIDYRSLILLSAKEKIEYLKEEKIDVVVDDRPDMPQLYNQVCNYVFMPLRPYNVHTAVGNYTGINNFYELLNWLFNYGLLPQENRYDL